MLLHNLLFLLLLCFPECVLMREHKSSAGTKTLSVHTAYTDAQSVPSSPEICGLKSWRESGVYQGPVKPCPKEKP